MIDVPVTIRALLLAQPAVAALVESRVWAEADEPPAGWTPASGPGIAFRQRAGRNVGEERSALLVRSVQILIWGERSTTVHQVYRALFDALDGAGAHAPTEEVPAQTIYSDEREAHGLLTIWQFWLHNGG